MYGIRWGDYRDLSGPNAERLFPLTDAQGKDAPSVYRAGCLYPLNAGHRHPECVPTRQRKTSSRQKHENRRFIAPSGNNDFREKGILQRPHLRFAPLRCNVGARCRVPAILPLRHFAPTILRRESGRFAGFLSGGWGRPRSSPPPSPRAPLPPPPPGSLTLAPCCCCQPSAGGAGLRAVPPLRYARGSSFKALSPAPPASPQCGLRCAQGSFVGALAAHTPLSRPQGIVTHHHALKGRAVAKAERAGSTICSRFLFVGALAAHTPLAPLPSPRSTGRSPTLHPFFAAYKRRMPKSASS